MVIDLATGKEADYLSPAEVKLTDDRCLLSFALTIQVMEAVRDHKPINKPRLILAASSLDLAFEHHGAIARLSHLGHFGSANALIRPLLESVAAGIWLMYCCSDHQADLLEKGRFTTDLSSMLRQLEKKLGKRLSGLRKLMENETGKIFHGFTHGGMDQLRWRPAYSGIGNNHGHKQILASLIIADIAMVNAVDAASIVYECEGLSRISEKWIGQVVSEAQSNFGMPAVEEEWQPFPPLAVGGKE